MKLIDAIKQKGRPFNVPGSSRDQLPEFCREMGYQTGAEIGVYQGEFTEKLCQAGLAVYGIDPWMPYRGQGRSEQRQDKQEINYNEAVKRLAPYQNCRLIKKTSSEALADFKPECLDFVYIDGDHRFPFVAEDIYGWSQKVRKGGMIAGHDYYCTAPSASNLICQVKPVVDAFLEAYGISDFYTFGDKDRYLSWMIVKPR